MSKDAAKSALEGGETIERGPERVAYGNAMRPRLPITGTGSGFTLGCEPRVVFPEI